MARTWCSDNGCPPLSVSEVTRRGLCEGLIDTESRRKLFSVASVALAPLNHSSTSKVCLNTIMFTSDTFGSALFFFSFFFFLSVFFFFFFLNLFFLLYFLLLVSVVAGFCCCCCCWLVRCVVVCVAIYNIHIYVCLLLHSRKYGKSNSSL